MKQKWAQKCTVLFTLALFVAGLTSCASYFKRKECEQTNWFQHGQDVAMQGKNLENDTFVNECRRVEAAIGERALDEGFKKGRANYCEPDTAFMTGKKGEPFVANMCEGHNLKKLTARHAAGVREFCQPDNGESFGATGASYKKVCPKDLEAPFLVEFKKGRKKFLAAEIDAREGQIVDIEDEIDDLERDRQNKSYELASVRGTQKVTIKRQRTTAGYRGDTGIEMDQMTVGEDDEAQRRRDSIQSEIDSINSRIQSARYKKDQIREQVRKLRSEMLTL